jgi:hypothetical protein
MKAPSKCDSDRPEWRLPEAGLLQRQTRNTQDGAKVLKVKAERQNYPCTGLDRCVGVQRGEAPKISRKSAPAAFIPLREDPRYSFLFEV